MDVQFVIEPSKRKSRKLNPFFINKLRLDPGNDLSKKGVFRVLGKILGASPDNIQREVTTGVEK